MYTWVEHLNLCSSSTQCIYIFRLSGTTKSQRLPYTARTKWSRRTSFLWGTNWIVIYIYILVG